MFTAGILLSNCCRRRRGAAPGRGAFVHLPSAWRAGLGRVDAALRLDDGDDAARVLLVLCFDAFGWNTLTRRLLIGDAAALFRQR